MKSAVLWTGGKDCALAHYLAQQDGYEINSLVTFTPASRDFKAHSLKVMELQAAAMGLPLVLVEISEPYDEAYKAGIRSLRDDRSIDTLITGDIAEVDGYPNWIRQCAEGSGVEVLTPLWGACRKDLTDQLLRHGFKVILFCVKEPWLTEDWLGRELTEHSIVELQEIGSQNGLDLCGENGEFHSLVLDSPLFNRSVILSEMTHHKLGEMMWLQAGIVSLAGK